MLPNEADNAPATASAARVTTGVIELENAMVPRWTRAGAGPDMT